MRYFSKFSLITFSIVFLTGATFQGKKVKSHFETNIKFLELKSKKELTDKKIPPLKKYTLAILMARELLELGAIDKAMDFYKIANETPVAENKNEINFSLNNKKYNSQDLYYFKVNLKELIENKNYEKAILSINPTMLHEPENAKLRVTYDLLNSLIREHSVKKLYCLDDYQKFPEDYNYQTIICDILIDFNRGKKIEKKHIEIVEEYFMKYDFSDSYLMAALKELE